MDSAERGLGGDASMFGVDGASGRPAPPGLTEQEAEAIQLELTKVEDEILTLRQVLSAKERHATDLRRALGVNPLSELKTNISKGWQEVQASNAYMRTSQTLGDLNTKITSSNVYLTASATLDDISRSDAYKKTQETLSQAGQVTSSAFSTLGLAIRSRIGEMRALTYTPPSGSNYSMRHSLSMPTMRNSPTFKNLEDKVSNLGGTRPNGEDA